MAILERTRILRKAAPRKGGANSIKRK
ncbi:hypothetical protein CCACVL1_08996 [Corchorus capsularis]|uniref:Uncharacterized protein n=1 Tax=Corchorus capsularis TaxID=210143 RepID=A0A1R3IY38_COCAP|nr:hypothetical protein CCACVL1_08996 [Corchorus capsularis]